jgi:hypothetical protein
MSNLSREMALSVAKKWIESPKFDGDTLIDVLGCSLRTETFLADRQVELMQEAAEHLLELHAFRILRLVEETIADGCSDGLPAAKIMARIRRQVEQ